MRLSCNGCRILRKGCTDDCIIRPCLHWIKSADSQANATLFLAKFYGRAGLMNLINAGPEHLRPDIFKSLLYEACGRIVDPMYGSAGLLSSGNWQHCQAAVDAVLSGSPIMQVPSSNVPVNAAAAAAAAAAAHPIPHLTLTDIRHVIKDSDSTASHDLPKVKARRTRSRRFAPKPKSQVKPGTVTAEFGNPEWGSCSLVPSHEKSLFSVQTLEGSLVTREEPDRVGNQSDDSDVGLELTLGLTHAYGGEGGSTDDGSVGDKCNTELEF